MLQHHQNNVTKESLKNNLISCKLINGRNNQQFQKNSQTNVRKNHVFAAMK
jgi:hypothetical protein